MGSLHWEAEKEASRKMKPERKSQVEKAFANADKDGTGTLSINQFMEAMEELAEDDDEKEDFKNKGMCEMVIAAVDGDGDKAVTLEELMKVINEEMDDETMFRNLLKNADKDGDGLISAEELKTMMLKMDPEEDDVDMTVNMIIRMCSHDSSKKIKPDELISFFTDGPKKEDPKEDAKRMFRMFDTNKDGYIDKKELAGYFQEMMGDDDDDESFIRMTANMMLASSDEDKNGKLNYEELTKMMEKD